jgi:hypothetical protein
MPAADFNQLMFHVGAGYMYQTRQAAIGNSALEICLFGDVWCFSSADGLILDQEHGITVTMYS